MKPHREAEWSFAKGLVLVGALIAGAGMTGAFGDTTTPPPDLSKMGTLFQVVDEPVKGQEPKQKSGKKPSRKAREMCPDDPEHCWWQ